MCVQPNETSALRFGARNDSPYYYFDLNLRILRFYATRMFEENNMNKADLTEVLASRAGIPKVRAANYINIVTDAIQEALVRDEKVTISDFGTFTVSKRREFTGHNPKNGKVMKVPARRIPVFRAGKGLKNALNS